MKRISVLIPTFGRPERFAEAVKSVRATAAHPERIEIQARVAAEDPRYDDYVHAGVDAITWYLKDLPRYPEAIEFLRSKARGDIFFCGSDDSLFRTPGWDELVDVVFEHSDGLLVAYANNGLGREKCEQFFTTRRWVEAVGYLMRPEYEHFCCDQHVEALAQGIGRLQFLPQLVVEHMHKKYGKAPDDDTYRRVRGESGVNARDLARFELFAGERADTIERLRALL